MSSKRSFLKQIQASMGSLLEKHGLSLLEEREEPEHFGNAFAKFESPSILLRIAKDRGDILVDIAKSGSQTERWHKLQDVLILCRPIYNYAGGSDDAQRRKLDEDYLATLPLKNDLASVKSALAKHLGTIEDRFSKHQIGVTERSLNAMEQKESERVVERIFGKKGTRSKVG